MNDSLKAVIFFMFNNQNSNDSLVFSLPIMGTGYNLSRNFKLTEAQSKCGCDLIIVHPSTIILAQTLRDKLGRIKINSWYRSVEHNEKIGGVENSKHTLGMALDVVPLQASLEDVLNIANTLAIGGIGIYESFIHLDVYGENRRWKQI